MSAWRVFIGLWDDPEVATQVDQIFTEYAVARAVLVERYERWRGDSCEDCVATAADDEAWLATLSHGDEFVGQVEGDDFLLIRADRDDLTDLWDARLARDPQRHHAALMARVEAKREVGR